MKFKEAAVKFLKNLVRPKTIREIIAVELKEAHFKKLQAESGMEYAKALAAFNEQRIIRLQKRLAEHTEEGDYT